MQHGTEPGARGVAFYHERCIKIRQLEHWCCGQRPLECCEHRVGLLSPNKALLVQEACQWRHNGAVVLDEALIVTGQPQEAAESAYGLWARLVQDAIHLGLIHGDALGPDYMAEVCHRCVPKKALGLFEEKLLETLEHRPYMPRMTRP